jgi:hypothetical protein
MPEFVLGFKTFADAHPEVGKPLADEFALVPGVVNAQPTTTGLLVYYIKPNAIHFFAAAAHS